MTTALALDTDRLRRISALPKEPALRQAATFLADLVRDPAFLESEILPLLNEAKGSEDWYVARRHDAEDGSFSLQVWLLGINAIAWAKMAWGVVDGEGTGCAILGPALAGLTLENGTGFVYLGVVGTALAYALWFGGLEELPASSASFLSLPSAVVAAVSGFLVLGEAFTPVQLLGVLAIFAGVLPGQFVGGKGADVGARANEPMERHGVLG